jgi:hypothetical protein
MTQSEKQDYRCRFTMLYFVNKILFVLHFVDVNLIILVGPNPNLSIQKSKRLRPIREPRKLAASFVKAVTAQIATGHGGIARNGVLSLFSGLQRMLPRVLILLFRVHYRAV